MILAPGLNCANKDTINMHPEFNVQTSIELWYT